MSSELSLAEIKQLADKMPGWVDENLELYSTGSEIVISCRKYQNDGSSIIYFSVGAKLNGVSVGGGYEEHVMKQGVVQSTGPVRKLYDYITELALNYFVRQEEQKEREHSSSQSDAINRARKFLRGIIQQCRTCKICTAFFLTQKSHNIRPYPGPGSKRWFKC